MLVTLTKYLSWLGKHVCIQKGNVKGWLFFNIQLYSITGLASHMYVLFWTKRDFPISFSNSDSSRKAWNWNWRSYMVNTVIELNNIIFFLPQNSTWHSEAWLYTMTPSTNLTFHPKMTCHLPNCASFPWDICNRCSMLTDYALSSDNKSRSILGLYCLYFLRPILFPSLSWLSEHCHFNIQRHFKTKYIQNFNYCMQWYWSK